MVLKGDIQRMVQGAFALLAAQELAEVITYYHVTAPVYNTTTGAVTDAATTHSDVKTVLVAFTITEKDDSVVVTTDRKALIAYNDLPIEPTENDYFITSNGERWEVKKVLGVPGDSLHKIHVRRA